MVATNSRRSQGAQRYEPKKLWYAPHRRIRTDAAAREAKQIARNIMTAGQPEEGYEGQALFRSLQTCAYQAARPNRGTRISKAQRRRWASRWTVIRDHIVEENLPLARWLVTRQRGSEVDEDTLFSEASMALVHAVERFNPWLGYRFSTYASNAIVRAMMRLGKRERRYRELFPVQHDVSFERPHDPKTSYKQLCVERLNRILDSNAGDLTGLESRVIAGRFGLQRERRLTLQELGDAVGLSKERIRQLQQVALDKLRRALAEDPVLQ